MGTMNIDGRGDNIEDVLKAIRDVFRGQDALAVDLRVTVSTGGAAKKVMSYIAITGYTSEVIKTGDGAYEVHITGGSCRCG